MDVLVVSSLPLVELILAEQAQLEGMLKKAVNIPLSGSLGSTAINLSVTKLEHYLQETLINGVPSICKLLLTRCF